MGEPPLLLCTSIHAAVKNAIYSAREDQGCKDPFQFDTPATQERIRLACLNPSPIFTSRKEVKHTTPKKRAADKPKKGRKGQESKGEKTIK